MRRIKPFLQRIKKNFREFKKEESGGEIINQILMLVVALLLIALILWFALVQFQKAKDKALELFGLEDVPLELDKFEIQEDPFLSNKNSDEKNEILLKEEFTENFHSIVILPDYIDNLLPIC